MSFPKVVVATYMPPQSVFKIPKNIDLEDKSIVKDWGVKWDKLYICQVKDDEELIIEPYYRADDEQIDLKYANDTTIQDAQEWFEEEEED